MFEAVGDALRAAAPVLLVLDDLHWADEPSLRLLAGLDPRVSGASVLVIGTYRYSDPEGVGLSVLAVERRLVLGGLPSEQLGLAVTDATGEVVDGEAAGRLHRRTGGNQFFAAEIVRLLRSEGADGTAARAIPSGVRAVLDRRLARLPATTESALRAAVVEADTATGVDTVLLAAVAAEPAVMLTTLLAPAIEARLVLADDNGRHRFPHALVAETLTARTPPDQLLELHRRAATVLERRVRAGVGDAAGVARHLVAAAQLSGTPAEGTVAAAAAGAAAQVAMEGTAFEDAVRWLEAGLAMLPDVATAGAGEGPDRGTLLCALGEAALAAGDPIQARRAFGLELVGHPPFMIRETGGSGPIQPPGVTVSEVHDEAALRIWERVLAEGYPPAAVIGSARPPRQPHPVLAGSPRRRAGGHRALSHRARCRHGGGRRDPARAPGLWDRRRRHLGGDHRGSRPARRAPRQ